MDATVPQRSTWRIAIVGGGISGLAAAWRLQQAASQQPDLAIDIALIDAADRLGGVLGTEQVDGYLIERAADNFLTGRSAPWAEQLFHEAGLADELIGTNPEYQGAEIFWRGRRYPVPAGFQLMAPTRLWPILTSPLLSPAARLRMMLEPFVSSRHAHQDQSLRDFVAQRLGGQAARRLVEPLVAGIYTADPSTLSVQAALPQMVELVRQHGSLYRGMRRRRQAARNTRGARYSLFAAPKQGMQALIDRFTQRLDRVNIQLGRSVRRLSRDEQQWCLMTRQAGRPVESAHYDAVILALPAYVAAQVLAQIDPLLAEQLHSISYAPAAIACLGYAKSQFPQPLKSFGTVVANDGTRVALAVSHSSLKFPHRAPEDHYLVRVFLGGALRPELLEKSDAELLRLAADELQVIYATQGVPKIQRLVRWERGMPQYELGHVEKVADIFERVSALPGLALAGNAYSGVGMPPCVRSGTEAADRVLAATTSPP